MSSQKKQRTTIADLPDEGNELFDLSEEVLMMVGVFGGSGSSGTCCTCATYDECQGICKPDPGED
jgi:hypothetical protein